VTALRLHAVGADVDVASRSDSNFDISEHAGLDVEEDGDGMVPWWEIGEGGAGGDAHAVVSRMWGW